MSHIYENKGLLPVNKLTENKEAITNQAINAYYGYLSDKVVKAITRANNNGFCSVDVEVDLYYARDHCVPLDCCLSKVDKALKLKNKLAHYRTERLVKKYNACFNNLTPQEKACYYVVYELQTKGYNVLIKPDFWTGKIAISW